METGTLRTESRSAKAALESQVRVPAALPSQAVREVRGLGGQGISQSGNRSLAQAGLAHAFPVWQNHAWFGVMPRVSFPFNLFVSVSLSHPSSGPGPTLCRLLRKSPPFFIPPSSSSPSSPYHFLSSSRQPSSFHSRDPNWGTEDSQGLESDIPATWQLCGPGQSVLSIWSLVSSPGTRVLPPVSVAPVAPAPN